MLFLPCVIFALLLLKTVLSHLEFTVLFKEQYYETLEFAQFWIRKNNRGEYLPLYILLYIIYLYLLRRWLTGSMHNINIDFVFFICYYEAQLCLHIIQRYLSYTFCITVLASNVTLIRLPTCTCYGFDLAILRRWSDEVTSSWCLTRQPRYQRYSATATVTKINDEQQSSQ